MLTTRVPSARRIWIDVTGSDSSTAKFTETVLGSAGTGWAEVLGKLPGMVAAGAAVLVDGPPKTLPDPLKGFKTLGGAM